ncbi:major facilitator superfamily domain-containing protein [Macrophomina phaseolina]|uniref:Major facilitator superfamily domain-containing protein n=1 Tax=Macrophomina phaseolina TaxID=35725 RepID=A0ABQ8FTY7_9PEZI|nr:major facilitator superfamily domain-containing protein [Macrophomina phaseolina]
MPLGIINTSEEKVPGTVSLIDEGVGDTSRRLKHATGKNAHIVLVPQPSEDPNDPLNWPLWKKDVTYAIVFIATIIFAAVPAPMLAPATVVLSTILGVTLDEVAELSGYQLLLVGCFGPIVSALARKYGKRPQFIFAAVMGVIGTGICIAAHEDYDALLAGRLVQGLGTTAFESLSVAFLGDIYFVHERGVRTGIMVLCLTCTSSLVAIIGGPITSRLGWRYMFIIHLPFAIAGALAVIFLVPETQFRHPSQHNHLYDQPKDRAAESNVNGEKNQADIERIESAQTANTTKKTYLQSLAPYSGNFTDESPIKLLVAPLVVLLNPAVFWTILDAGIIVAFYVSLSYVLAQIWSMPPYNLSPEGNGYFYVGGLLGGLIGGLGSGKLCDISSRTFARLNRGIYEPEFRIPVQIIAALLLGIGYFVFMWKMENPTPKGYYLGAFCHGCICCGITVASNSASLYILDSYKEQATEIFILQMTAKNLLFYGFSTFVNTWVATDGPPEIFRVYGIVSLCIVATCIPMYVFGKVNRQWMHSVSLMQKLGVAYV